MKKILGCFLIFLLSASLAIAQNKAVKNVLVLVEGQYDLKSLATAEGRQMAQLLGHFKTNVKIDGVAKYKPSDIEKYDYVFYIGFNANNPVPAEFARDVLKTSKPVIWINSGFAEFSKKYDVEKKFGFSVSSYEANGPFTSVKVGNEIYSKGATDINYVQIADKGAVEVWATATQAKGKKETPYMLKSKNLIYVADMPFVGATETDRYLYFSDKLHDILNEKHPQSHQAIIRIEDVTPLHNPDKLREIADIFAERGIPFLVGVVPIYVNPAEDRRVTLSERPEMVDALKYMVQNGGTIVMHGVTHQYRGLSTDDCEFWDGQSSRPIKDETEEDFHKKMEMGIEEFFKNGIYPLAWETPHYEASVKALTSISKYFSTCVEQRMVIDNFDYGQYFPYTIEKDIYGQKVYPENLGYIPMNSNPDSCKAYVDKIIENARSIHRVSDGIASCFFHPFLDLSLLKRLADGLKADGFTFLDISHGTNKVKAQGKVVINGTQSYKMNLNNSYLSEVYFDDEGKVIKRIVSADRIKGEVSKNIVLEPGQYYKAEGIDYKIKEPSTKDKIRQKLRETYAEYFGNTNWKEARVSVCWNPSARGAAYHDQASLVSVFKSVNINVDTIFIGENLDLKKTSLLVVPYASVDSLTYYDLNKIVRYVKDGGNLITDRKNKLIKKFGVKFVDTEMKLQVISDKYFPQEYISWRSSELANKFDYDDVDEVFAEDAATSLPVVIGKEYGNGKLIYFNTSFDPNTSEGYSRYPYILEYVKKYFNLRPIVKRENLEFYFDPGLRQNNSIENLVKQWVKNGIRIVHVAGWHQYVKYNYDYKRIINLAHANGIMVYAWMEPPQVSPKFWGKHPEWREKNYKGQDVVQSSWRSNMALTDDKCFAAVADDYINLLKSFDWDGVNIAELYFETNAGFKNPDQFAPMHPSACNEFKKKYGFDMRKIFDKTSEHYWEKNKKSKEDVINYRVDKLASIQDKMMKIITAYAKTKKNFGVVFTFLDSYFSPELKEHLGISSDKIIDLQKKYNFMLQPEDPQNKWSTNPLRYTDFGKFFAQKMNDPSKLLVDLNILSFRNREEVTPFPTLMQTGVESYHLINSAALGAPRFTIYGEATCNAQDFFFFPYASSSPVKYEYTDNGYEVNSPYSFVMQLPKQIPIISVDGQSMVGYRDNMFLIPAGKHTINCHTQDIPGFSTVELQPQLLSLTGNLIDIKYDMRKVTFNYTSYERAYVSFNSKPTSIKVDGQVFETEVMKGIDCYTICLPGGNHKAEVVTGDKFSYGVNLTSLWSMTGIAIYGMLAVMLLVGMYITLKIRRKRLES